jgi:iron uptake system component EfeO
MLGVQPHPTVVETAGYLVYLVPMLLFVLWPGSWRLLRVSAPATLLLVALVAAGCGGGAKQADSTGAKRVAVSLTDAGCPATLSLAAGPTTFVVTNDGADAVSEFEILDGDTILGEVENLAPGLSGEFSLTLDAGTYVTYCPGGTTTERGRLRAVGAAQTAADADERAAVAAYRRYVERQSTLLVTTTGAFVDALAQGDVARAKRLYAAARTPYERIEPVAESFGDLDPRIDARAGDVPAASWTGFHPIEKILWQKGTTGGTAALGAQLLRDVKLLRTKVETIELEPAQIANGAVELLNEVSKSKITGEEERYSRIDLVDFEANVQGARAAFAAVRPILAGAHRTLGVQIAARFDDVENALGPYRRASGFVAYDDLQPTDTRALSRSIDALAEPLSRVGSIVVVR